MTEKQKRFCIEYAKSGNGTRAAIAAGYSERSAYAIASENLNNIEVLNYLEELTGIQLERDTTVIEELVRFYMGVVRDKDAPLVLRLKAADSLQKRCAFDNSQVARDCEDAVLEEMQITEFIAKVEAHAHESEQDDDKE